MTEIDFYAGCSNPAKRFELHARGLGGPAVTALHLVGDAVYAGRIEGEATIVEVDATGIPGRVLREVLEPMRDQNLFRKGELVRNSPLFHNADELLDFIDVEATYSVSASEL